MRIQRQEWRQPFYKSLALALMVLVGISGCATSPSVPAQLPVTGGIPALEVHEYVITEQSTDNPTHLNFQNRAQAAVSDQQAGWHLPSTQDVVKKPNEALAPFHYRLAINPTPPFSAFALYHNEQLVQRDIASFWPISLKTGADGEDFLLTFQTLDGQKLIASQDGVHNWMDVDNAETSALSTPAGAVGDKIAFADTANGAGEVYAGSGLIHSGAAPDPDPEIFDWQLINGQPFYFYAHNGSYRLNYAMRNLPLSYDHIIHSNTGETAIYNPGSLDNIVWFYALRDGLWYYVEVGNFN